MAKYYFTKKAIADLTNIWDYTYEEWSEFQADKYYQTLIDDCKEIATTPDKGRSYNSIADNLLGVRSGRHIIFYRKVGYEIEITRILHERMDLKKRILE